jgi:subtilisin family serine protease
MAEPESASGSDESADLAKSAPKRERRTAHAQAGKAESAPEPAPAAAAVASTRARSRGEETELDEQVVHETLLQRADRLFTQGRWAEAAIAYRDLLRLQPNSPSAERWRRRLSAARTAVATGRPPPPSAR